MLGLPSRELQKETSHFWASIGGRQTHVDFVDGKVVKGLSEIEARGCGSHIPEALPETEEEVTQELRMQIQTVGDPIFGWFVNCHEQRPRNASCAHLQETPFKLVPAAAAGCSQWQRILLAASRPASPLRPGNTAIATSGGRKGCWRRGYSCFFLGVCVLFVFFFGGGGDLGEFIGFV